MSLRGPREPSGTEVNRTKIWLDSNDLVALYNSAHDIQNCDEPHRRPNRPKRVCLRKRILVFSCTSSTPGCLPTSSVKYFCETLHLHLPVNSLTSALDCFVFMHNIKRPKIIHCGDLVLCCSGTWPLIDGHPILDAPSKSFVLIHSKNIFIVFCANFLKLKLLLDCLTSLEYCFCIADGFVTLFFLLFSKTLPTIFLHDRRDTFLLFRWRNFTISDFHHHHHL